MNMYIISTSHDLYFLMCQTTFHIDVWFVTSFDTFKLKYNCGTLFNI